MHTEKPRIAGLFDVSLGYGSPQTALLLRSLADHLGPAHCIAIEPDQKGRRLAAPLWPELEIRRFGTRFPPHDELFQIEFNQQIAAFLAEFRPHVVVAQSAWVLPALLMHEPRPQFVIYQMLEDLDHQLRSGGTYFVELNAMARDHFDLVLVPERRRGEIDFKMLGWKDKPIVEVLNAGPRLKQRPAGPPLGARKGILVAGTIASATLCDLLLDSGLEDIPIDLVGPTETEDGRNIVAAIKAKNGKARYLGLWPHKTVEERRMAYAFSLVAWRPDFIGQALACPNKLFETIAAGVPPICAPHPQCIEVISEYDCGILMNDWTANALTAAITEAVSLIGTPRYARMVENCWRAHEDRLNWEKQFELVRPHLPRRESLVKAALAAVG